MVGEGIITGLIFIILLISYQFGFYLGKNNVKVKEEKHLSRVSSIQAGLMGLLGVMLAFSFSISSARFEQRRQLIIQESLNIGTAYFRAGLLPDTLKSDLRNLLRQYLDERINFYKPGNTDKDMQQSSERAQDLQVQIWAKTAVIGKSAPNLNTNITILALNSMIDISGNIASSFQSHVPTFVLLLLVFMTICTILTMGYSDGITLQKNIYFAIILIMVFCFILLLIIDMDRPTSGFLKADIYGLVDLKKEIEKYTGK